MGCSCLQIDFCGYFSHHDSGSHFLPLVSFCPFETKAHYPCMELLTLMTTDPFSVPHERSYLSSEGHYKFPRKTLKHGAAPFCDFLLCPLPFEIFSFSFPNSCLCFFDTGRNPSTCLGNLMAQTTRFTPPLSSTLLYFPLSISFIFHPPLSSHPLPSFSFLHSLPLSIFL